MQTTLETTGQLERRLNVAVPVEQIESEVQKRLQRLARNVKVPGFGCHQSASAFLVTGMRNSRGSGPDWTSTFGTVGVV